MKLYVSSYRLGSKPEKFKGLFGENKKVAVIMNAVDDADREIRKEKFEKEFTDLTSLGLMPEELDLRNYFGKESKLKEKLSGFGGVWIRGGNTFVLRRAMRYSGFDTILREKKKDKNFVYGGYSAGICILSPNLKGLDVMDDPNLTPEGYQSETIWEGLSLLPYLLIPHFQSDHSETHASEESVEYAEKNTIAYKTLRDGDVLIEEIY